MTRRRILWQMRGLILIVVVVVIVGLSMRMAGVPIPLLDYPIGPIGVDSPGPGMPDIRVEPPGFGDLDLP